MKIAVIGSGALCGQLSEYIPRDAAEIISDGADEAGNLALRFAEENKIPRRVIPEDREKYGRMAALWQSKLIVEHADRIIAFWDGISRGTEFSIDYARQLGKPVTVISSSDKKDKG